MKTPASIKNHPLHPMLIAFPIGLWIFSLICDGIGIASGIPEWHVVAFYTMAGGLVGGLIAAVPGTFDLFSLKDKRAKTIGFWHMSINIAVVTIFAIDIGMRVGDIPSPPNFAIGLSVIAVALLAVSGWLGGELVHVLRVGVIEPDSSRTFPGEMPPEKPTAARNETKRSPLG
jgi:uncharacterized membrane protein